MNQKEALKTYREFNEKIKAYTLVLSTTDIDRLTVAPRKGSAYRNKMLSIIEGELYELQTDKRYVDAILYLSNLDLGEIANRDIALAKKSLENILKFSKEETMEYSLAMMNSYEAWYDAKNKNDYRIFEPHLLKLIDMSRKRLQKRNPKMHPYDLTLDDFEEDMNRKKYDRFFSLIKKELLPLIRKIDKKKDFIDDSFLYLYYPAEKQAIFMKDIMKHIGFSSDWGYMATTEHPFTDSLSRNDVRVTTAYDEHNITSAIFSLIHECGHGFYEHQIDPKFDSYPYLHQISSGMHESQSRFFENYLGRRKSFFKLIYPKLQKLFPENLDSVSLDDFIRAVNVSRCSLIRTDADELTYPIHILIRYELEKEIFENKIDLNSLDRLWDERYEKYLAVKADKPSEGILQDVHWSGASFGYFPTYALGSAIGAQIFHKMQKDLDVDDLLEKGKFSRITDYLKKNIQHYGALYSFEQILLKATGEEFNPRYYIDYLKNKYMDLYMIKK
ncbi:MAG: carboxypeptidase M32 [Erysipelotrichaceae bacterium]|nr:carboxypeptidase M32 [Erysipelotrichaceae bacterium]